MKIIKVIVLIFVLLIWIIALDWLRITQHWNNKQAKFAIVYWSKVENTWKPSPRLQARLDTAFALYEANEVERIIVSGWVWESWFDEAEVMKTYLINKWVKIPRIIVDSKWDDTMKTSSNAYLINKLRWNYPHVWVVAVSQFYHLSRVKLSLRKAGFVHIWAMSPEFFEWRDIYSLCMEVPAYFKYFIMSVSDKINLSEEDIKNIKEKALEKISENINY